MDDALFDALCASVKEAGAIRRGEAGASRETTFSALDVKAIRESTGRTQETFAQMIGVSLSAVRSWEQGKRTPTGPARALLTTESGKQARKNLQACQADNKRAADAAKTELSALSEQLSAARAELSAKAAESEQVEKARVAAESRAERLEFQLLEPAKGKVTN